MINTILYHATLINAIPKCKRKEIEIDEGNWKYE